MAGTLLAVLGRRYAWADRANPGVYGNLCEVYDGLRARLEFARAESAGLPQREAARHLTRLGRGLGLYDDGVCGVGLEWSLGVGYVDLRNAHRAEEALLLVADEKALVGGAVFEQGL